MATEETNPEREKGGKESVGQRGRLGVFKLVQGRVKREKVKGVGILQKLQRI